MPLSQEQKKYTYADYLKFPSDERWERVSGTAAGWACMDFSAL